ncbi:MAG TPA: hypothetical protein VFZ72_00380 [Jiangellaceae bacterium]|jgi:hypothetical protein
MSTLLLFRITGNDSTDVVSQTAESVGIGDNRIVLFVIVALATVAGLHLTSRAMNPIAEVIKSVIAVGLGLLLIAAAVGLAFVLAITAI